MKNKTHLITVVLGVVILLAGVAIAATATQEGDLVERGRADYVELGCYQCHGFQGQGGAAPRLAPEPISLDNFMRIVRRPPNVMPAYSPAVLSEEQLERMHAYLESIPQPPDVSSLPLLSGE
jgi:ubiquinol-cytochrome c reductase cytochrome c subunit